MKGTLIKISDDKFGGNHPNGIVEGYKKDGIFWELPKNGNSFYISSMGTSEVTSIKIAEEDTIRFTTLNSTYELKITDYE